MSSPSVAIVILNWNGKSFLEKFLPSVLASTYSNKQIIIADNASTDDSLAFVQLNFPSVHIIKNRDNEGFAKGYNTALAQVQSDYYVLLNSDVEVDSGWIEPIIELMEQDINIGACQPKILSYNNKDSFEYAGACGGWIDMFGYPFARGRIFDTCEKDIGQYEHATECFWASGAALFVRSKAYQAMKGLDASFFAHQEEIDLCWRMQLSGYKVYVEPRSVVYHVGGGTLPAGNSHKVYLNFRNSLKMMYKNMSLFELLWRVPIRFMLDAIAAWKELAIGNWGYFWAVARAHFYFMGWVITGKKESVAKMTSNGTLSGLYKGSIIWEYFIKRKKTFREIISDK